MTYSIQSMILPGFAGCLLTLQQLDIRVSKLANQGQCVWQTSRIHVELPFDTNRKLSPSHWQESQDQGDRPGASIFKNEFRSGSLPVFYHYCFAISFLLNILCISCCSLLCCTCFILFSICKKNTDRLAIEQLLFQFYLFENILFINSKVNARLSVTTVTLHLKGKTR